MSMNLNLEKQRGVSLVELLIAMALGLILLAGIGYIYWGSRQSYALQENLAGLQENAGFALEVMGQDVRMAGYIGCPKLGTGSNDVTPVMLATADSRIAFDLNNDDMPDGKTMGYRSNEVAPVLGVLDMEKSGLRGTGSIAALSDILVVNRGSSQVFVLNADPTLVGGKTTIAFPSRSPLPSSPRGLDNGQKDVLLISDCTQADIFHVDGVTPSEPEEKAATVTANVNLAARTYRAGAMVMGLETTAYFIRNNPNGVPSLYRARWAPDATEANGSPLISEVADNVQNMRVQFGVDSNNDGSVDGYFRAAQFVDPPGSPAWNQVVSVRVSLLLRSASNRAASQPQPYSFDTDGDGALNSVTPSDNYLYRVHTATMAIRNRASGG